MEILQWCVCYCNRIRSGKGVKVQDLCSSVVVQPLVEFRQFADVKDAAGAGEGQEFHWNGYSEVATQGPWACLNRQRR